MPLYMIYNKTLIADIRESRMKILEDHEEHPEDSESRQ
jgi:hypothetical protein